MYLHRLWLVRSIYKSKLYMKRRSLLKNQFYIFWDKYYDLHSKAEYLSQLNWKLFFADGNLLRAFESCSERFVRSTALYFVRSLGLHSCRAQIYFYFLFKNWIFQMKIFDWCFVQAASIQSVLTWDGKKKHSLFVFLPNQQHWNIFVLQLFTLNKFNLWTEVSFSKTSKFLQKKGFRLMLLKLTFYRCFQHYDFVKYKRMGSLLYLDMPTVISSQVEPKASYFKKQTICQTLSLHCLALCVELEF